MHIIIINTLLLNAFNKRVLATVKVVVDWPLSNLNKWTLVLEMIYVPTEATLQLQ